MASTTTLLVATLLSSVFVPSVAQVIKGCPLNSMANHLANVFHIASPTIHTPRQPGATFATAGATVMPTAFFVERDIRSPTSNVQFVFTELLTSFCGSPHECTRKFQRALIFVDQIGTNNYKQGPGATHLIVPGSQPMGCFPGYVTMFQSKHQMHYDTNKCHIGLNTFMRLHNDHLIRQALMELRKEFPGVEIV
ncbi:hypothetical protein Acr_07g0001980 [Actinidia rufa]|uniref:Uncharacterized protein n=1 Tax=Actinidia rufa TaxID=165716 RepID=A0A7J0EU31_9ERIC|nr:hypothetical protein Acr_07g0001980 [Actinidia rufa]